MKTFIFPILFLSIVSVSDLAYSQNTENTRTTPTLEEQVTDQVLQEEINTLQETVITGVPQQTDNKFLTFAIENDLFASGEDQYYTNGFRLSYFEAGADLPDWARGLGEVYPGFRINDTTSLTFSIGQNLYTPRNIEIATAQPDDRPWAAWLYASAGMVSVTNNNVDELEVALGVVGPLALGEEVQSLVHKYTDSPDPKGWDNQIENEIGLALSWSRRWPEYFGTSIYDDLWFSAAPQIGVTLGNIYTHAEVGMNFRISPMSERLSDLPLRVRPSMPGTGYFKKPSDRWSWSVFGGVNGRAVGRNIFLDGNTFRDDSPSVDRRNFVYDVNAGVDFTYGQTRVSYTAVRRSKEFNGQDDNAVFGAVSISRRF
jgi:lipid A 3-O-deacylase